MLTNETVSKLREMHLGAMAEAFVAQLNDAQYSGLSFEDRFSMLVDSELNCDNQNLPKETMVAFEI